MLVIKAWAASVRKPNGSETIRSVSVRPPRLKFNILDVSVFFFHLLLLTFPSSKEIFQQTAHVLLQLN